jgi:hypothetical protein
MGGIDRWTLKSRGGGIVTRRTFGIVIEVRGIVVKVRGIAVKVRGIVVEI